VLLPFKYPTKAETASFGGILTNIWILHSDQGAVYTSYSYQMKVKEKGITTSMSRPGKPSDNAPIECFHGYLKHETFHLEPQLKVSVK
jgi:putative transposase